MLLLCLAVGAFVGLHFWVGASPLRGRLVSWLGEGPFKGLYSLVLIGLMALIVLAYRAAPAVPLWSLGDIGGLIAIAGSWLGLVLIVASFLSPRAEDGTRIVHQLTRHPMNWGIALLTGAHALAVGEVAALVLFGGMMLLAVYGSLLLDRRQRAAAGSEQGLETGTDPAGFWLGATLGLRGSLVMSGRLGLAVFLLATALAVAVWSVHRTG